MEFNQKFFLTVAAVVCAVAIVVMLYSFIKSYFFRSPEKEEAEPESVPSNNDLPGEDVNVLSNPVSVAAPVTITITSPSPLETEVVHVAAPELVIIPAVSNDVIVFKIENAKPKEDKWGVKSSSETLSTHKTQYAAEKSAIEVAKQSKVSVVVLGRSGEIRKKMMYTK